MENQNQNQNQNSNLFLSSNIILELDLSYALQAEELAKKIQSGIGKDIERSFFVEIDCVPSKELQAFHYRDGLKSVIIFKDLSSSAISQKDHEYLNQQIEQVSDIPFKTDFKLGAEIGLWKKIIPRKIHTINWNDPFSIKLESGPTKIWRPDWQTLPHHSGYYKKPKIIGAIKKYPRECWLQYFHNPLWYPNGTNKNNIINRLLFLCNSNKKTPELIGGLRIGRAGLKVFISDKSTVGLIIPPKER